ncbi:serine hydrolase domain-containing protein [Granulicella paludicola]|uniref:serine hydrolase domain-containing protein n=1 Tax=Granulicella paludicola TaxID=474951 RepID=UPI0021E0FA7E|nr:serine hydrolase domain-containing protein [Granulicella paludicola]
MKSNVSAAVLLLLSIGGRHEAFAQHPSAADVERIDHDIRGAMSRFHVPGTAVMALQNGRVVFVKAYGDRDIRQGLPVKTDTLFEIGSITKQFTAACILQLRDQGKLSVDDTLSVYLPDAPHAKEVTLRNLLTHTSGLHDYLEGPDAEMDKLIAQPISYQNLLARVASLPLDFPPGSQWSYSNTGYMLLGRVIEAVSGEPYKDYLQHHILNPLHMNHTFTTADEDRLANMAIGYRYREGKLELAPPLDSTWGQSAGFLISDLADLSRWDRSLRDGTIVSPASYREMSTAFMTTKNGSADYGFGLFVASMYGQPRIGHTGGSQGFTTADEYYPEQRLRLIAFTNSGDKSPEAGETITNILFADLNPTLAANALKSAPGEDEKKTQTVRAAFRELQGGASYAHFSSHLRERFTTTGSKFAAELSPYGQATAAVYKGVRQVNGESWYDYVMQFGPGVSIPFSVRTDKEEIVAGFSLG